MTTNKLIEIISLLCALFYIIVGITHFLMPSEQLHFASGVTSEFFISLSENATAFHFHYWAFVIASILTIGVITCITNQFDFSILYRCFTILAIIGLSVTAYDFARMHYQAMDLTEKFIAAESNIREVILLQGLDRLDANGIGFNLLGFYLIILCCKTLNKKILPKHLSLIGLINGFLLQFVLVGTLMRIGKLIDIAAGIGGMILTPFFFIGVGRFYIKKGS